MATYNAALKGYVADVQKVIFRRCDGKAYAFDELFKQHLAHYTVMCI